MHVDWDWIYQRPQILGKKLEEKYDIKVIFNRAIRNRRGLQKKSIKPSWYSSFINLPKYQQNKFIGFMNNVLQKIYYSLNRPDKFDILWFCYPFKLDFIPDKFDGIVIYDCMDDHASMPNNSYEKIRAENDEKSLLNIADIVFVSSATLYNKIKARVNNPNKLYIIRNGYPGEIFCMPNSTTQIKDHYTLGYIGTIAPWFDFDLLIKSLGVYKNIEYSLIGPNSNSISKNIERINFIGTVEHSRLYDTIKNYDCLLMPFILDDLILAVDPVKLYEYISYGKCIISVYYPEIDRFKDFVYFYTTESEFEEVLKERINDGFRPKYNATQQAEFLESNSWDIRINDINAIIQTVYTKR